MKIALLFPGYGSQCVGMGKELYDEFRVVQDYFEEASNCLGINFVQLCFASSDARLSQVENAYISTFIVSSALAAVCKELGIVPDIVTGYNFGEYAAIHTAGGITTPDALYLLTKYAHLYTQLLDNRAVEILYCKELDGDILAKICAQEQRHDEYVSIAASLAEREHIVSGDQSAVQRCIDIIHQNNGVCTPMNKAFGLHSILMQPVADALAIYLEKVDIHDLSVPLLSCTDGLLLSKGDAIKSHVIDHISSPIKWSGIIKKLGNYDILIQIGPGTIMHNIVKKFFPDKHVVAINTRKDIEAAQAIIDTLN